MNNQGLKALIISGYMADILSVRGMFHDDVILVSKQINARNLLTKIREVLDDESE